MHYTPTFCNIIIYHSCIIRIKIKSIKFNQIKFFWVSGADPVAVGSLHADDGRATVCSATDVIGVVWVATAMVLINGACRQSAGCRQDTGGLVPLSA